MKKLMIIATMVAAFSSSAFAESPYCVPKADGKDRFTRQGSFCPSGYISSGACCIALHADMPRTYPKIDGAACPSGYFSSNGHCKKL